MITRLSGRDSELREETLRAIRRYNAEVPYGTLRITIDALNRSRKMRIRERKMFEAGLAGGQRFAPLNREIAALFPENQGPEAPSPQNFDRIR